MNIRLLAKLLGILSALIGATMVFSLPWALPSVGRRSGMEPHGNFEAEGFFALSFSILICFAVAAVLYSVGRKEKGRLYRKEAMAVVGLSWILATVLGALPFLFSGTHRGPTVRVTQPQAPPLVINGTWQWVRAWRELPVITHEQFRVIQSLVDSGSGVRGLSLAALREESGVDQADAVFEKLKDDPNWADFLIAPGQGETAPSDRASHYRIRWTKMTFCDALFESQSGFSTTGASVISELEDSEVIQYCMLFWRSSTHFLGGLGIIVLFVVLLGQGSAGKALMRTEMPGPTAEGTAARMQHSAWAFAGIYVVLNLVLTVILLLLGMSPFDALCHAFGTMATGGFSTYNASLGNFHSAAIQYVVIVFMILAGTNFTLLYFLLLRQPGKLLGDIEWRTFVGIIVTVTAIIVALGMSSRDAGFASLENAVRFGLFQVASILTTTGFATNDFDSWNQLSRLLLLILMFVGGCAGSTGGGMKVVRPVLFGRILWIQLEKSFHPRVVRPLRASGDESVDDAQLSMGILAYFGLVLTLFVFGWVFVVGFEPDNTWGDRVDNKLIDSASAIAATLNNIGPGLGAVGPTENYANFSGISKILFVWLMMLGRLEIWPILVLFAPSFWRDQ